MKKFLNKKGTSVEQGYSPWHVIIALVLFVIMGFFLMFIINDYISAFLVYDKDIPRNIYAYRAVNTCLAYQDSTTGRYYPGIIDYTKYNQEVLDDCYNDTSVRSFNIQLVDKDKGERYDRILVGFGASRNIVPYPVFIRYEDGTTNHGELLFGMSGELLSEQEE